MPTQTGPEYINYCRQLGFSDQEIGNAMKQNGWTDIDIHAAFSQAATLNTKQDKKPKSTLLYVLIGIGAFVLLSAVGALLAYLFVLQ